MVFDKNQMKYLNTRLKAVKAARRPLLDHKVMFHSKAYHFRMFNSVLLSKSAADPRKEVGKLKISSKQDDRKLKLPGRLAIPELEFESVSSIFDLLSAFGPVLQH